MTPAQEALLAALPAARSVSDGRTANALIAKGLAEWAGDLLIRTVTSPVTVAPVATDLDWLRAQMADAIDKARLPYGNTATYIELAAHYATIIQAVK